MKPWIRIVCGACALLLSSLPLGAELKPGDRAPGFALQSVDGKKMMLGAMLAGKKPVIVSFFATWCQPCLKEIPKLRNVQDGGRADVYLVNIDEAKAEKVAQFLKANSITLPVLLDPGASTTGDVYGVLYGGMARVPKLFLIAPSGTVKYVSNGYDENIESILAGQISLIEREQAQKPRELALYFTNSANAYLESCDCPTHPYGGLVRRATYLAQERALHRDTLVLDSGDFFKPYISEALADTVLKVYERLGYDAVCPGDQEFSFGRFADWMGKYKIPFLSSNISYCEGDACRSLTPSSMIVEKAGLKILLVSVLHPDVFILYPESVTKHITFLPLNETLSGILERNKGKYDLAVLVSHSGDDADKQIAQDVPGFDIIVGGHSQTLIKEPVKIGGTLIVQAGADAQNVGKLLLSFDENRKISSYTCDIVPLTKDIPDDNQVRALIDAYKQTLKTP